MTSRTGNSGHHDLGRRLNHPLRSRHRGTEKTREDNVSRIFLKRSTVSVKFTKPLLEEETARGRRGPSCGNASSFSRNYSQRGCGNYGCRYSGSRNSRNIFGDAGYSLCLCASVNSSAAGGESFIRRAGGFTLIEVLVASVILFAGLGGVLKAYSMAVAALDSATDVLITSSWMHDKAVALELQVKGGAGGASGSGRTRLEGREYQWRVEARRQSVTPDVQLHSAVITMTRSPSGTPRILHSEWAVFQEPEAATAK
jgi:hypothetical protein